MGGKTNPEGQCPAMRSSRRDEAAIAWRYHERGTAGIPGLRERITTCAVPFHEARIPHSGDDGGVRTCYHGGITQVGG